MWLGVHYVQLYIHIRNVMIHHVCIDLQDLTRLAKLKTMMFVSLFSSLQIHPSSQVMSYQSFRHSLEAGRRLVASLL